MQLLPSLPRAGRKAASSVTALRASAAAWDSFPPADGDSICGGYELEISGGQNAVASVANWSPVLAADTVLAFNVDSCTTVQRATVHLRMELN